MNIQRIASFCLNGQGGNPAGVVIGAQMPTASEMQKIAADLGYSETAFAAPEAGGFRARYFAPEAEVPFCGHATIALGAALGAVQGAGRYELFLNNGAIETTAFHDDAGWGAQLLSPPTSQRAAEESLHIAALGLFGWSARDIDPTLDVMRIHGGADHLLIPLTRHDLLRTMQYDFGQGGTLMRKYGLVTISLIWRESPTRFHARNPFAGHGVYEDPATGAAAAALAGYLRDTGRSAVPFDVLQGAEMGAASCLLVEPLPMRGGPVQISGATRIIAD